KRRWWNLCRVPLSSPVLHIPARLVRKLFWRHSSFLFYPFWFLFDKTDLVKVHFQRMTTLNEILAYLTGYLEPIPRDDYCPNGLQVEGRQEVKKGAFAVSASVHVIEEAVKWGADFLFVHHGIFWQGDPYPIV